MSNASLLFVTGTARSGTTLLAQILNAHPCVAIALDPYLPLLRSFRNAAIRSACEASTADLFTSGPLQDYYFTNERLAAMDAVQAGTLEMEFDPNERDYLSTALAARAGLEAADLVPLLSEFGGKTYRELFDQALNIVAQARDASRKRWLGIKEVWSVEFCNALAGAYPDAKFVVIMRDPRAVVASMRVLAAKDASQRAHTLSYARHWRKFVVFCEHYFRRPQFRGRLLVIRYEDIVATPALAVDRLCKFLEIDPVRSMTAADGYRSEAADAMWMHNSSYEEVRHGIDGTLAWRWQTALEPSVRRLVELVCEPEMQLLGYSSDQEPPQKDSRVLEFLMQDAALPCSWRSDLGNPSLDYQLELDRWALLNGIAASSDRALLRRNILFENMLDLLRGQEKATCALDIGLQA